MTVIKSWNIQYWPSLYTLFGALLPLTLIAQLVLGLRWSFAVFALLLTAIIIKIKAIFELRRELFMIFDKCNIPSVENKNLISGNLFEMIVPRQNYLVPPLLHKRLGKTFGTFYAFDPYVYSIDLDLLQEVFVTGKNIDRASARFPFIEEFNLSLAAATGDQWRQTRRILDPSFTSKQMHSDNVFRDVDLAAEGLLTCIAGHPKVKSEHTNDTCRLVDVCYNFKKYSADVILRVAFGCNNGINMKPLERDHLIDAVDEAADLARGPIVWASIMLDGADKYLGHLVKFSPIVKCLKYIHSVLDQSLRQRRHLAATSGCDGLNRKMIDSIIESAARGRMSDDKIKANLYFIFVAGFETTANTMTIMFWLLARHPEIQEKLRKAVAADGADAEYLDWCIRETLRLYPAVPNGVTRTLGKDLHWKGQTLMKGTQFAVCIYAIHHSAEIWGPDVEEFKPERFADADSFHPMQEFSFSHGPRYCLGKKLADSEMKTLVSRLLLRYRVEPTDKTPQVLHLTNPNIVHMIIHDKVELRFVELSSL